MDPATAGDGERVTTYFVEVRVTLRDGLLDPQGHTVRSALNALGFDELEEARIGKLIRLRLDAENAEQAERQVRAMCEQLLANPVTEDFSVQVLAASEAAGGRPRR